MRDDKKFRVLIIDDDHASIVALNSILSSQYNIHVTKSGREGIKIAEQYRPDIILLDIAMPHMDGFQILTALKNSTLTRDIPVLFVTARLDKADEEKGLSLGAIDYIRKPFVPENVRLRVSNHLRQISSVSVKADFIEANNITLCDYMAKISVEMKTPLNEIIKIASHELHDVSLSEPYLDVFTRVTDAANLLLRMVDELSDISDAYENKLMSLRFELGSVLVIDDSDMCRNTTKRMLSLYGLKVDTASSGVEGIEKIQSGCEYDCLFVDYLMTEIDGVETVKRIRELGCIMPIIAITADTAADRKDFFIESGFDELILKPLDFQAISSTLRRVFRNK